MSEVYDEETAELQSNKSSRHPIFSVSGLEPGRAWKILIYAANIKGRSDAVMLDAFTLKVAEKQTGKIRKY